MLCRKSYKINCPQCGKDNFYTTEHNGLSYCFNCGHWQRDGEHAYEPKVRSQYIEEIRNYYKQAAYYYHAALDTAARNFLYSRGFTDDTIQQFLIGFVPNGKSPMYRDQIGIEAGLALPHDSTGFLAGRITFPYFYNKDTIVDIRGRAIDPNEEVKYKSPYHSSYYRGANYLYNNHLAKNDTILISEGEIKADLAVQIGYAALAMPGMNNTKTFSQRDDQKVIIIFDSQKKNQHFVNKAIDHVARTLIHPYVATLPLMNKDKMDCDSYILEYGKEAFDGIIGGALTYNEWKALLRF